MVIDVDGALPDVADADINRLVAILSDVLDLCASSARIVVTRTDDRVEISAVVDTHDDDCSVAWDGAEVVAAGRMIVQLARRDGRDAVFSLPAESIRAIPADAKDAARALQAELGKTLRRRDFLFAGLRDGLAIPHAATMATQLDRVPVRRACLPDGLGTRLQRMGIADLRMLRGMPRDALRRRFGLPHPGGRRVEGVEAASWAYLGKPAARLSHAEAALLAVLPQAPSRLRPDRHPQAARRARDKVLARMQALGHWTDDAVADARIEPVVARSLRPPVHAALLAQRLRQAHPRARRIDTTLDAPLQRALEERVSAYFAALPPRTSAALLVVDNATMQARAYVGSVEFGDRERLGHVDMVRAWRSPGSTLKPFLYGMALDDGLVHSGSLLVDAPQDFGGYRPGNFGEAFNGPVSAAGALQLSLNVPAVDLLDRVGPARFAARLDHAGISLRFPRGARPNLALILGGTGVRLEDLVGAYAAFQRQGVAAQVRYTPAQPLVERRLLSPGAAWIVRDILQSNPRPGQAGGVFDTGSRPAVAWKTGTSYGFRDAWAVGGTRRYTVGVWIGRPDGTPLPGQYGQASPAALSQTVMMKSSCGASAPANTSQLLLDMPLVSQPRACKVSIASGLTRPIGWLPALYALKRPSARWFIRPSARMLRALLPVHRNRMLKGGWLMVGFRERSWDQQPPDCGAQQDEPSATFGFIAPWSGVQVAPSVLAHTCAPPGLRSASDRASANEASSSLVVVDTRFERSVASKLGNAMAARIATIATTTISSTIVKPLARMQPPACRRYTRRSPARSLVTAVRRSSGGGRTVGSGR